MSDSSRTILRYVEEVAWGTTPAAALKTLRMTGESLKPAVESTASNEIRSDRQVPDLIRTSERAEGDINFELSYGTYDELLEGALMSDWVTDGGGAGVDLLENGTTLKSYTIEKEFADIGQFFAFKGMRVSQMRLTARPGAILTGSFGFMGKDETQGVATVGTGAPVAATNTDVMNAVSNLGTLQEGGVTIADILSLDLTLNNNLRNRPALASLGPVGIGAGRCVVTGTMDVYFQSGALYTKAKNFTATSLNFTLTDAAGNVYVFTLPRLKFGNREVLAGGPDQDVVARLPFQAIRDTVTDATIQISRNPA